MELNEQTLEQILTRQREEYQRHMDAALGETRHPMGMLVEGLESKIEAIAEGHAALREKIAESNATLRQKMKAEMANICLEMEMMRSEL